MARLFSLLGDAVENSFYEPVKFKTNKPILYFGVTICLVFGSVGPAC